MSTKLKAPLEEYLSLPEGYPAELIGGRITVSPSPTYRHQSICGDFFWKLKSFVENEKSGEVLYEFDVHFDDDNVLRPDILFIKSERKDIIKDNWVEGVPDMVIEVISPSSAAKDTVVKREVYERFGVKEYWIVDPENEDVFVYENREGRFILICAGKECSSKVLKGFKWGFSKVRSSEQP